ncbi:uncharacterized protein EI90DRAFT_3011112 [Cantharellus anzutake]|uniref:uncharacterized protein n=1 Tax=Cantharellus anzutake TaxID=1750568 RepID=UPI0019054896|nr:uncharacterized protein EI90DRAFT_3011112 [Cantharellus anzutake]KAF8342586.1 hypothetical protein EI90DRAFT_3011112 [Cantharellus anzutake]
MQSATLIVDNVPSGDLKASQQRAEVTKVDHFPEGRKDVRGSAREESTKRSYAVPDEIDEEDLQAELEALSSPDADGNSYLDDVVSQPTHSHFYKQNGVMPNHDRNDPARAVAATGS